MLRGKDAQYSHYETEGSSVIGNEVQRYCKDSMPEGEGDRKPKSPSNSESNPELLTTAASQEVVGDAALTW